MEALHRDYLQAPETEGWIHRCEAVAALSPLPAYTTLQVLYLSLAPLLWEHYQKRGLSHSLWFETMLDLKYKLWECQAVKKIWGSFVAYWYDDFFRMKRFSFGRLQGEIQPFRFDSFREGDLILKKGDPVINVHIPRTLTPLSPEECDESFRRAADFFAPQLKGNTAFVCNSWILFPENETILKPDSNVLLFRRRFHVLSTVYRDPDNLKDLWRIFDTETTDFSLLPENGSLRRNYKAHLLKGGRMGSSYGVFFYRALSDS